MCGPLLKHVLTRCYGANVFMCCWRASLPCIRYGALPLLLVLGPLLFKASLVEYHTTCGHLWGNPCVQLWQFSLLQGGTEAAFGGATAWSVFIKVLPLIFVPRSLLTAFRLRHFAAAARQRQISVATKVITRFMEAHRTDEALTRSFVKWRGFASRAAEEGGDRCILITPVVSRVSAASGAGSSVVSAHNNNSSLLRKKERVQRFALSTMRSRNLHNFYRPVPLWALIAGVVPAAVCCLFVLVRLGTAADIGCGTAGVTQRNLAAPPCAVRSFPVFDLQFGSEDYCPCNVVAYSEYVTSAAAAGNLTGTERVGNCTSDRLTKGRRELAAIARASPLITTVAVDIVCPESLSAVVKLIKDKQTIHSLNVRDSSGEEYALSSRGAETSGTISSSSWDDAIRSICFKSNEFKSVMFRGMQGRTRSPPPELAVCVGPLLMQLHLVSTGWERLPKLDKASQLIDLDFSNNRLIALPKLDKVPELVYLYAYNNTLTALPNLDKVPELGYLDLSHNQITSSATWEALRPPAGPSKLKRLGLAFNRLDRIPTWVGQLLPSLDFLDVSGNNISRENIGIPSTDDTMNAATTAGLLLLSETQACGGDQEGTLPQTMWGRRWDVHCASRCVFTCPAKNDSGRYFSDIAQFQRKLRCDPGCGNGACCVV